MTGAPRARTEDEVGRVRSNERRPAPDRPEVPTAKGSPRAKPGSDEAQAVERRARTADARVPSGVESRSRRLIGQDRTLPAPSAPAGPARDPLVDTRPKARQARRIVAAELTRPVLPDPRARYEVTAEHGGRSHTFELRFSRELVRHLARNHLRVDVSRGELVSADGSREALGAASEFRATTGRAPPPWIAKRERWEVFGLPMEGAVVRLGEGDVPELDFHGRLFVDFDVIVYEMKEPREFGAEAMRPAPELELRRTELCPGVALSAATPEAAKLGRELFFEHCGVEAERWPERLRALAAERQEVRGLIAELRRGAGEGGGSPAAIERARALSAPHDHSRWSEADAIAALRARIAEIDRASKPVELIVVPLGKHWTAMPQMKHRWEAFAKKPRPSNAANSFTPEARLVFLPEEDLRQNAQTSRHELNHLVFARLDRARQNDIRAIYERLVARGGPFARVYGRQWKELFTTFGEIFEGRHGRAALERFREEVPDLYEHYCEIRRRRPA